MFPYFVTRVHYVSSQKKNVTVFPLPKIRENSVYSFIDGPKGCRRAYVSRIRLAYFTHITKEKKPFEIFVIFLLCLFRDAIFVLLMYPVTVS